MSSLKKLAYILVLGMLVCPLIQKQAGLIKSAPLDGYFEHPPCPELTDTGFFSGTYQTALYKYMNDSIGFKEDFVRLYNQVDMSFFSIPHAARIIVGKKRYLFSDEYINSYLGTNFIGEQKIDRTASRLRFVQDLLWKKHHILLIVVFPPDKGSFYPEYIPDRYLGLKKGTTNLSAYTEALKREGVNFIDFGPWFMAMKDTSRYVLYPKTGIHWSNYAAYLAGDSLSSYIAGKLGIKMPRIVLDSLPVSKKLKDPDEDISVTLNTIWRVSPLPMAYPWFHTDTTGTSGKLRALVIGDSFYWNLYKTGYIEGTFRWPSFWFYNQEVYGRGKEPVATVGKISAVDSVLSQDVIILLQVNAAYGNVGYGFADQMYFALNPDNAMIVSIEKQMRKNPKWMEALRRKAKERHITLDEMIRNDAIYMINQQLNKKPENKKP